MVNETRLTRKGRVIDATFDGSGQGGGGRERGFCASRGVLSPIRGLIRKIFFFRVFARILVRDMGSCSACCNSRQVALNRLP
jgi:hypothetical protein